MLMMVMMLVGDNDDHDADDEDHNGALLFIDWLMVRGGEGTGIAEEDGTKNWYVGGDEDEWVMIDRSVIQRSMMIICTP